jgi:hypothetical protein
MTIWSEKTVTHDEWDRVQALFEEHFAASKQPSDMMLVCVEGPPGSDRARLIAALPHGSPLYPGFVEIEPKYLPDAASLLVDDHERRKGLFELPS